eukprot:SAG31_NODE_1487_length_8148_cov_4.926823_7_plen_111_part_00
MSSFRLNTGGLSLGSWLIGLVYLCFILSNQVAASVVGTVGAKWTMFVGSIGYFLCTAGVVRTVTFSVFLMGLSALNLPCTHREIDCYIVSRFFMGLFALNLPCAHRETRD